MVVVSRINGPETLVSDVPFTAASFQSRVLVKDRDASRRKRNAAVFFMGAP
jgi:hypothetical protein